MIEVFQCLATAAVMLTVACSIAALLFRRTTSAGPRLRQAVLFGVLLQGLMLFRLPVELPWLASDVSAVHDVVLNGPNASDPMSLPELAGVPSAGSVTASESLGSSRGFAPATRVVHSPTTFDQWNWWERLVGVALSIWIVGLIGLVARSIWRYRSLCRLIDHLQPAPQSWQNEWQRVCGPARRRAPEMLVAESAGPMLVRRPAGYALVVPGPYWESLSSSERRGVLLHECAHLCRHDVWRQLIARFAVALHWWNPAAWWCLRRYEESAEWSCDESLTRHDPLAAKGLASSLVRLVEFLENETASQFQINRGLGVQSMAAPPLTARVVRLLNPTSQGDSVMKRMLLVGLAFSLLILSAVQFRLVAADPDDSTQEVTSENAGVESALRVFDQSGTELAALRERLNTKDKATADLDRLLDDEAGQVAFAGLIDLLQNKYREKARGEAIPRFVERHFETDEDDKLALRETSRETAEGWISRSEQLGDVLHSMSERMNDVAERIDDSTEVNRLAKRMLTDEEACFAIILEEFDGRSDPIELFLGKAFAKILVGRGEKLVLIPTLGEESRRQIERFKTASEVAEKLGRELPDFADEFAESDERHERLVAAMKTPAMSAVLALRLSEKGIASASSAVDELFEQLEELSKDTADGLVIVNDEAWENLEEILDLSERASKRVVSVRERMKRMAANLDTSDPLTERFADELTSGVIAYQVAAELPYEEFDLGKQIEAMVSQVMEPTGSGGLRVRQDATDEVSKRAEEVLTAARTIRRYLRRIDSVRDRMLDRELAESLDGPGRMLLLTEIRNQAQRMKMTTVELLEKEFFVVDEATDKLTVHPKRIELIGQLSQRARELEAELKKDDF